VLVYSNYLPTPLAMPNWKWTVLEFANRSDFLSLASLFSRFVCRVDYSVPKSRHCFCLHLQDLAHPDLSSGLGCSPVALQIPVPFMFLSRSGSLGRTSTASAADSVSDLIKVNSSAVRSWELPRLIHGHPQLP
jgi:hypothetical protein